MNQKIQIIDAKMVDKELMLQTPHDFQLGQYTAVGQMLVDSENFSFIYLVEKNNEYTYIVLPEAIWSEFKIAIDQQASIILTNNKERLELIGFNEEIVYLIENIKGNSNYGEDMVAKVESTF